MPNAIVIGHIGLLILNSVSLGRLGEATCTPPQLDESRKWKNAILLESAMEGSPNYGVPAVGNGFNRTLNLDGFCNNIIWAATDFKCAKKKNEWHAALKKATGAILKFDNADCALHGVTIAKKPPGSDYEAELRLQFFPCENRFGAGNPPVSSAAIAIGLKKEGDEKHKGNAPNLQHWMNEVCDVEATPVGITQISTSTHVDLDDLGNGVCDSTILQCVDTATTLDACKTTCSSESQTAAALGKTDSLCTGFAWNDAAPVAEKCILYKGDISVKAPRRRLDTNTTSDDANHSQAKPCQFVNHPGFKCFKVNVTKTNNDVATPAPVGYGKYLFENGLVDSLHMANVMGGTKQSMTEAILTQVDPPEPFCYEATWWFSLQDETGTPAHISLNNKHFDKVMEILPQYVPEITPIGSTITKDRVLVQTCTTIKGWGRSCVMPAGKALCDSVQMINSIVTGLLTPILSWLLVNLVYSMMKGKDRDGDGPEAAKEAPKCDGMIAIICCIVAIVFSMVISYGSSTILEKLLGKDCFHEAREHIVVWLASGGAAAVSMLIAILYLFHQGRKGGPAHVAAVAASNPRMKFVAVDEKTRIVKNPNVLLSAAATR